jgi:hypothetical protein
VSGADGAKRDLVSVRDGADRDVCVANVLDRNRPRCYRTARRRTEALHLWIVGVQHRQICLDGFLLLRVGLVGVLPLPYSLEYPGGIPLREFNLLLRLGVGLAPDLD